MRLALLIALFAGTFLTACASGSKENDTRVSNSNTGTNITDTTLQKMTIKIGTKTFHAVLADNPTAKAFRSLLPLTLSMTELNGNEKYFNLPNNLPANAVTPKNIRSGDLMLWGANTIVLFYKSFPTSYSYTQLGKIENPEGLAAALGSSSIVVSFELE